MKTGLTLITMAQGNPIALKKTLDSFSGVVNEIIFGDLIIFEKDRNIIQEYEKEYNLKIVKLPFNYIFTHGFSDTLNSLAKHATNDWVIYMNCSEVIDNGKDGIIDLINSNKETYNAFCFNHKTDLHRWYRCYNKSELKWSGLIHEEVVGERRFYPEPIFMMADTEKDVQDEFYSKVMDSIKEICYFNQYLKLIDQPHLRSITNDGWIQFSKDGYHSFIKRLHEKGDMYESFITGDFNLFIKTIFLPNVFGDQKFDSSLFIEYQQSPMFLGKK